MRTLTALFLIVTVLKLQAQKLPNVQRVSLRAPAGIKIDGKATEWDDKFQAYNKATGVFYSVANDDENLYVVIYSNDVTTTTKILGQGINIRFNTKEKSTDKGILIKYPIGPETTKEYNELKSLARSNLSKDADDKKSGHFRLNKALIAANKHVRLFGVNGLTDTLFSIYDAKGITVSLDSQEGNLLCYELSVPLKYLGLTASSLPKLNYNIRLNEDFQSRFRTPASTPVAPTGGIDEGTMMYATDFWGEYILAK